MTRVERRLAAAEASELVVRHDVRSGEPWLKRGALFRDESSARFCLTVLVAR